MLRKVLIPLLAAALALSGCSSNPVTGKSELMLMSEGQEIQLGEQYYLLMQQAEGGDYITDPEVQKYVDGIGQKLARVSDRPKLPYEFVVLNNSVPNAWSLPGGKIAINRGLLQELKSEGELAAVLGHEIVHSAARHTAQRMQRGMLLETGMIGLSQLLEGHQYEDLLMQGAGLGAGLIFFKYSREDEREADFYGIKYMVAAGYDPQCAVELQKTFVRLSHERGQRGWADGLFASHPPSEERVENNTIAAARYPAGGKVEAKEYEKVMARLKRDKPAYEALDKGYLALVKGNAREALSSAEEGIRIEPKEAHLFNLKGKAELKLAKKSEAMSSFNRAIDLNPNYFDFYLQRGLLKYQQELFDKAEEDLKKSIDLLPTAEAHNALGNIALRRGNKQEALDHFRIAESSPSIAGTEARRSAQKLDKELDKELQSGIKSRTSLPQVNVEVELSASGHLNFYIENRSSQNYPELLIELTFYGENQRELGRERVRLIEPLKARQKIFFPSSFLAPKGTLNINALAIK
ncbi:MAG: M48 family metalloprotease [Chlamydiales bacterium]|nr:M48 family metalloprotease [Chlamydiales bacterium]